MKTIDVIILALCVGTFLIGVYETFLHGITFSYPTFMVSIALLFVYSYRRRLREEREEEKPEAPRKRGPKGR